MRDRAAGGYKITNSNCPGEAPAYPGADEFVAFDQLRMAMITDRNEEMYVYSIFN